MKIVTKTLILLGLSTFVFSDETMCFKKNHTNLETIETIKLDGGLCAGKNSKIDMQKKGWYVKNIEIKNDYYIYVFKKEREAVVKNENISKEKLKLEILTEIRLDKEKNIQQENKDTRLEEYEKGKKIYLKKCSSCHGVNGEKEAGDSQALNSITLDKFKYTINGYRIGSYDLGNATEMKPYSIGISSSDVKNIHKYLQNIK